MGRKFIGTWLAIVLLAAGGCAALRERTAPPSAPSKPTTAPRVLTPGVKQGEAARLEREVQSRIQETERLADTFDRAKLTPDQEATASTIRSFLERAKQSLARQDLAGASNLAEKAHALAEELARQR